MTSDRRAPRAILGVAIVFACLVGLARGARAAANDELPPRPEVRMHLAGDVLTTDVLADGVRARLEALNVTLTWDEVRTIDPGRVLSEGAVAAPALAEVWLDARAPNEATLLVLSREGDGVLARRLTLPSGLDDVAQAELTYILESAVRTLLAAEPFGVSREAARAALEGHAPPPPATPAVTAVSASRPAPVAPAPRLVFQIAAAAGTQSWSKDQALLPAAGLFVGLERVASWGGVGFAASGGLRADVQTTTPDAIIVASGIDLHLWATLASSFARAQVWRFAVGPGLLLDDVGVTAAAGTLRTVRRAPRTDIDPTLAAMVRLDFARIGHVSVFAATGIDILLRPSRYTAVVDGVPTTVSEPWLVRPSFALGVAVAN